MAVERGSRLRIAPALTVAALLLPPAFVELVLAVPPSLASYLVYGGLSASLLWYAHGQRAARVWWAAIGALTVALSCLFLVPWNARKAFLHEFRRIEPGMPIHDVDERLRGYEFGERRAPDDVIERTYVHSRAGRFDSDWGVVRLQHGRVAGAQFLPD